MKPPLNSRLTNVLLRGSTLACKFALIFFLARLLPPAEIGTYGLMTAGISYAIYIAGLEFHAYSTREIIRSPKEEWGSILKSQASITFLTYPLIALATIAAYSKNLIPGPIATWFIIILFLEHFAQESNRILVALQAQITSSIAIFVRSGAWTLIAIPLMLLDKELRNLDFALTCWAAGSLSACLLSAFKIHRENPLALSSKASIKTIKKGLTIAAPYIIATLSIRAIFTADRYLIEITSGLEAVAAYTLFITISNSLTSLLEAGIFVFAYPSLIKSHAAGNIIEFKKTLIDTLKKTAAISVAFFIAATTAIYPIIKSLDKEVYIQHIWTFPVILMGVIVFSLGQVIQMGLYSSENDKATLISNILSLAIFLTTTIFALEASTSFAIPIGICCGMLANLSLKSTYLIIQINTKRKNHEFKQT